MPIMKSTGRCAIKKMKSLNTHHQTIPVITMLTQSSAMQKPSKRNTPYHNQKFPDLNPNHCFSDIIPKPCAYIKYCLFSLTNFVFSVSVLQSARLEGSSCGSPMVLSASISIGIASGDINILCATTQVSIRKRWL